MEDARSVLVRAIANRTLPGAVAEVGNSSGSQWREALGVLRFDRPTAVASDTIFDLASLTKPISTTAIVMDLVAGGRIDLDEPLTGCFDEWHGGDREIATVRDLLEHASGLAARLVDPPPASRREFEHEICGLRLEYTPRTKSIYSDLGFILLGFVAADRGGAPLNELFERIRNRLDDADVSAVLRYGIPESAADRTAPTEPLPEDVLSLIHI